MAAEGGEVHEFTFDPRLLDQIFVELAPAPEAAGGPVAPTAVAACPSLAGK